MPVSVSHSLTVRSTEPEINLDPSGENASEVTEPECPEKGSRTRELVSMSQTLIVLSKDPETILVPSREIAMEVIEPKCQIGRAHV